MKGDAVVVGGDAAVVKGDAAVVKGDALSVDEEVFGNSACLTVGDGGGCKKLEADED